VGSFIQLDRCNAGPRLTHRDGGSRTAPIVATLVRQPYMNDAIWDDAMREWLGMQAVFSDSPVHAWTQHEHLGTVQDLLDGKIRTEDARG
jgi:hypothetical protein